MNWRAVENVTHDIGLATMGFMLGVLFYGYRVREVLIDAQLTLIAGQRVIEPIAQTHRMLMYGGLILALVSLGPWAYLHARRRTEGESG